MRSVQGRVGQPPLRGMPVSDPATDAARNARAVAGLPAGLRAAQLAAAARSEGFGAVADFARSRASWALSRTDSKTELRA